MGVGVCPTKEWFQLSQKQYIVDILKKTNMIGAKPVATPVASTPTLSKISRKPLKDGYEYWSIVGMLQYLTITRLDIQFVVNKACQFLHNPTDEHWKAVRCILRYLCGTLNLDLKFSILSSLSIKCICNADWVSCVDDRRSTRIFAVFIGKNLISWSSYKQNTMA